MRASLSLSREREARGFLSGLRERSREAGSLARSGRPGRDRLLAELHVLAGRERRARREERRLPVARRRDDEAVARRPGDLDLLAVRRALDAHHVERLAAHDPADGDFLAVEPAEEPGERPRDALLAEEDLPVLLDRDLA